MPTSVIEVTFDPTFWNDDFPGTDPGCQGYDCTTIWPDKDGTTFWAFQQTGGTGWARVNYSDGTIVQQGAMFGVTGADNNTSGYFLTQAVSQQSVMWQQDDTGHYYAIDLDFIVYRFHIDPVHGTPGSILNGYDVTDNTFDTKTIISFRPTDIQDMTLFVNNGTRYLAFISGGATATARFMWVLLADTLTFVGIFTSPTSWDTGLNVFADANGILWGMFFGDFTSGSFAGGNTFVRWDPADGTTGSGLTAALVTTTQFLSSANLGLDVPAAQQVAYVPATNSMLLGATADDGEPLSGIGLSSVSMDTFTSAASQVYPFFFAEVTDSCEVSFKTGVQSGQIIIQGDPGDDSQPGGILRIINPTTLVASSSLNATTLINGSGVPTPIGTSLDIASFVWNEPVGKVAVCYGPESFSPGSPVYIFDFGAPAAPTATFVAVPDSICKGSSGTLTWDIEGTYTSASIDNGVGAIDTATGTVTVSPTVTTTYELAVQYGGSSGSVIEVPLGSPWLGGGLSGYASAWTTFADLDGTTAWAFEAFGGGFARFNLSDGSIIRQDIVFGSDDSNPDWLLNFLGVGTGILNRSRAWFAQDTNWYYMLAQFEGNGAAGPGAPTGTGTGPNGTTYTYLFKFKVGSGTGGSLLNGYDVSASYFDIIANMTSYSSWTGGPGSTFLVDVCHFVNSGVNYVALLSGTGVAMQIVNVDTMTYVDSIAIDGTGMPGTPTVVGSNLFVDNTGTVWGVAVDADGTGNVKMQPWSGSFGSAQFIPQSVSTLPVGPGGPHFQLAGYLPGSNSVMLSNDAHGETFSGYGDVAIVSLLSLTLTTYIPSTGTLFFSDQSPAAIQSMSNSGVSADSIALEGGSGSGGQVGGVINFVNPGTLAVMSTLNATTTINSASPPVANPIVANSGYPGKLPPFTSLSWSPTGNSLIVTYGDLAFTGPTSGFGTPVYIIHLPSGHTFTTDATVTVRVCGTFADISRVILVGNADLHAPKPSIPGR